MDFINPTITIHNTTDGYLVRFQHDFGNNEVLDAEVRITHENHTLGDVATLTIQRLRYLLDLIDRPA